MNIEYMDPLGSFCTDGGSGSCYKDLFRALHGPITGLLLRNLLSITISLICIYIYIYSK